MFELGSTTTGIPRFWRHHRPLVTPGVERAFVVVLDEYGIGVGHGRVELAEQLVPRRCDRVLDFSSIRTTCWPRAVTRVLAVVGRAQDTMWRSGSRFWPARRAASPRASSPITATTGTRPDR